MDKPDWCTNSVNMGRIGNRPYWVLYLSIFIRAVHQVGAAVFLASFLMKDFNRPPALYITIVFISGIALLITEGMRHRQIYREVSGVSTFIKLIVLGAAFHGFLPVTAAVLTAFVLASIDSHTPKIIRHRLIQSVMISLGDHLLNGKPVT